MNALRPVPIVTTLALVLAAGVATWTAGCIAKPVMPVRIGTSPWTGYQPLFLARDWGYLDRGAARLIEYTSTTDSARAFRNGAVDAVCTTLDETIKLRRSGVDAKAVLVMDISEGADVILGRPEMKGLKDLKGRRVGLESTSIGDYVLSRALDAAGMTLGDVTTVPLEISEHERAFREGAIDAVVTYQPVGTRLIAMGARRLFDSSQIPGEIVDVLVVNARSIDGHRNHLTSVIDAWFKAINDVGANRPDALLAIGHRDSMTPADVRASLAGMRFPGLEDNRGFLGQPAPRLLAPAERMVDLMLKRKLIDRQVPAGTLIDDSLLPGAAR